MLTPKLISQGLAVAERFGGSVTIGKRTYTLKELQQMSKPLYPLPPFTNHNAYKENASKEQLDPVKFIFEKLVQDLFQKKNMLI